MAERLSRSKFRSATSDWTVEPPFRMAVRPEQGVQREPSAGSSWRKMVDSCPEIGIATNSLMFRLYSAIFPEVSAEEVAKRDADSSNGCKLPDFLPSWSNDGLD